MMRFVCDSCRYVVYSIAKVGKLQKTGPPMPGEVASLKGKCPNCMKILNPYPDPEAIIIRSLENNPNGDGGGGNLALLNAEVQGNLMNRQECGAVQ